jgi:hypothetical protein
MSAHKHRWRRLQSPYVYVCEDPKHPRCWRKAVVGCACGQFRCATHGPKPKRDKPRKAFKRWTVAICGGGAQVPHFDHEHISVHEVVRALNRHRVTLPKPTKGAVKR